MQGRKDGRGVWEIEGKRGKTAWDWQREKYRSVTPTTTQQLQHYIVRHTNAYITKCTRSVKIHSWVKLNDLYDIFKIQPKTEKIIWKQGAVGEWGFKNHNNNLNNTKIGIVITRTPYVRWTGNRNVDKTTTVIHEDELTRVGRSFAVFPVAQLLSVITAGGASRCLAVLLSLPDLWLSVKTLIMLTFASKWFSLSH